MQSLHLGKGKDGDCLANLKQTTLKFEQLPVCLLPVSCVLIKESFDTLQSWIAELQQIGPQGIILAIAGNKCDKEDERQVCNFTLWCMCVHNYY